MRLTPAPSLERAVRIISFLMVVLRGDRVTLSTGGLDVNADRVLSRRSPTRILLDQADTPRRLVQRNDGSAVHSLALPMATCKQSSPVGVWRGCVTPLYRLMISRYGRGAAFPRSLGDGNFAHRRPSSCLGVPPTLPSPAWLVAIRFRENESHQESLSDPCLASANSRCGAKQPLPASGFWSAWPSISSGSIPWSRSTKGSLNNYFPFLGAGS